MMVVVPDPSGCAGVVMGTDMPMNYISVVSVCGLDGVNMLGRKEGQPKHAKHCETREEAAQIAVQHHNSIMGRRLFRVKRGTAQKSRIQALPR